MITEEDARKKDCHKKIGAVMVKLADLKWVSLFSDEESAGIEASLKKECKCIASQCMGWEWDREGNGHRKNRAYTEWRDSGCIDTKEFETSSALSSAKKLYEGDCGLKRK